GGDGPRHVGRGQLHRGVVGVHAAVADRGDLVDAEAEDLSDLVGRGDRAGAHEFDVRFQAEGTQFAVERATGAARLADGFGVAGGGGSADRWNRVHDGPSLSSVVGADQAL